MYMVENKEVKLPGAFLYRRTLTVFLKKLFYKDGTYLFIFLFIYLFIYLFIQGLLKRLAFTIVFVKLIKFNLHIKERTRQSIRTHILLYVRQIQ